jgi:hypothetical protein
MSPEQLLQSMETPRRPLNGRDAAMACRSMFGAVVAMAVVATVAGCKKIEQAQLDEMGRISLATRVFVAPDSSQTPPDCSTAIDDVSWSIEKVVGVSSGGPSETVVPGNVRSIASQPTTDTPPQPGQELEFTPGQCVFRADIIREIGTYAVSAHSTFNGQESTISCSFDVHHEFEPGSGVECDPPDWVGFSVAGFTPAGEGCAVVNHVGIVTGEEFIEPDCMLSENYPGVFPPPAE